MGVFNLFKKKKSEEDNKPTSKFIDDEWLEVSANSKEEAIERACMALNTNPSHLEVKMLSKDGKKLQARKTDEKTAQAASPAPARESQPRQQQRPQQGRGQGQGQGRGGERNNRNERNPNDRNANDRNANSRNDRGGRGNQQNRPVRGPAPARPSREQNVRDEEQTDETLLGDGEYRGGDDGYGAEQNDQGRGRDYNDQDGQYDDQQDQHAQDTHNRVQEEEDFVEEVEEETDLGRKAKEILLAIVQKIEGNVKVELYETNKTIRLEIISDESGLFIGKFGQTLDSIQHLLKKILEIKFEDGKNLVVDAENYRVRREESIESKARKLAKKARQEGRPVSVEPMNAMDRRIVHMALKGEPGIETKSVGEGASRRVLIVPKRRAQARSGGGRGEGSGQGQGGRGRGGQGRGFGRGRNDRATPGPARDGNSRMHDSYDVPALPKSDVFGDNPEEYFENSKHDDEK